MLCKNGLISKISGRLPEAVSEVFYKKAALKNSPIFTRKHLCWSLFLIKLQAWSNFIKKRLQHRCFPVNIAKLKNTYFEEHMGTTASRLHTLKFCILIQTKRIGTLHFCYEKSNQIYQYLAVVPKVRTFWGERGGPAKSVLAHMTGGRVSAVSVRRP